MPHDRMIASNRTVYDGSSSRFKVPSVQSHIGTNATLDRLERECSEPNELRFGTGHTHDRPLDSNYRGFYLVAESALHRSRRGRTPMAGIAPLPAIQSGGARRFSFFRSAPIPLARRSRRLSQAGPGLSQYRMASRHVPRLCGFHVDSEVRRNHE